jgi:hypothetical protein
VLQLLTQVSESQLLKKYLRMMIAILTKLCTWTLASGFGDDTDGDLRKDTSFQYGGEFAPGISVQQMSKDYIKFFFFVAMLLAPMSCLRHICQCLQIQIGHYDAVQWGYANFPSPSILLCFEAQSRVFILEWNWFYFSLFWIRFCRSARHPWTKKLSLLIIASNQIRQ